MLLKVRKNISYNKYLFKWVNNVRYHGVNKIFKFFLYMILINFAFVFLSPFLYMISTSLKSVNDLVDPYINWIPVRGISWNNFKIAIVSLDYFNALKNSMIVTLFSTLGHVLSCSLVAYGFARIKFPGRNFLFMLVILTLIVPVQVIIIPLYMIYSRMKWLDGFLPLIIPTFLGMGLKGGLFIFIFRQYFIGLPKDLEDAARIDGCGTFKTFFKIIMPISKSPILVTSILSIVWHWNDSYEPSMFITSLRNNTLTIALSKLSELMKYAQVEDQTLLEYYNMATIMAAAFLVIIPVLILYFCLQKKFMEGIERSGIVG